MKSMGKQGLGLAVSLQCFIIYHFFMVTLFQNSFVRAFPTEGCPSQTDLIWASHREKLFKHCSSMGLYNTIHPSFRNELFQHNPPAPPSPLHELQLKPAASPAEVLHGLWPPSAHIYCCTMVFSMAAPGDHLCVVPHGLQEDSLLHHKPLMGCRELWPCA